MTRHRLGLTGVLLLLCGCRPAITILVPGYQLSPTQWKPSQPIAGVARVDITPPAGYPLGGHGPAGGVARGYWTRLYARAFFFADTAGKPLVLVSADLFAMPAGLTAAVAHDVALRWRQQLAIPPDAIIVAATHTHHSPGNYLSAQVYNDFGSRYTGFDRELFDFLRDRVASAVNLAIADALKDAGPVRLSLHVGGIDSLQLNRSPYTFLTNWNAQSILDALNPQPSTCALASERGEAQRGGWDLQGCPRRRGVDTVATVLRIDRGTLAIGAAVFFAVHPTVLEPDVQFYSSDFTGQAVGRLEREMLPAAEDSAPVVGFFNGAEGDVVARRGARDMRETHEYGRRFARGVTRVLASPARPIALDVIEARQGFMQPGALYGSGNDTARLAPAPMFGKGAIGGAEDDRTLFYDLGFREHQRRIAAKGQGSKMPALDLDLIPWSLTGKLAPPSFYPPELPLTSARLGALRLVAIPVEMSTAQAYALRAKLGQHGRTEIIGMANEYASYVATADEYAVQDYMAASTLWGPSEGAAIAWGLSCLMSAAKCVPLERQDALVIAEKRYLPGKGRAKLDGVPRYGPAMVGEPLPAVDDEMYRVMLDDKETPARMLPYFEWEERASPTTEFSATATRRVEILEERDGGSVARPLPGAPRGTDDDRGANFLTLLRRGRVAGKPDDFVRLWSAIWLAPILESDWPAGRYRFLVRTGDGRTIESCSFTVQRNTGSVTRDANRIPQTGCANVR